MIADGVEGVFSHVCLNDIFSLLKARVGQLDRPPTKIEEQVEADTDREERHLSPIRYLRAHDPQQDEGSQHSVCVCSIGNVDQEEEGRAGYDPKPQWGGLPAKDQGDQWAEGQNQRQNVS